MWGSQYFGATSFALASFLPRVGAVEATATAISDLCFAPTETARLHLLRASQVEGEQILDHRLRMGAAKAMTQIWARLHPQ